MRLRAKVFARDFHSCQLCARDGVQSAADQVDHIIPLSLGGSNEMGNLQSLCIDCHKLKTAREAKLRAPPRGG